MKKFLGSKIFVALTTLISLIISGFSGWLLAFGPVIKGSTSGYMVVYGSTTTSYVFQLKTAIGYWLLGLIISLVVFLLSLIIYYINKKNIKNDL